MNSDPEEKPVQHSLFPEDNEDPRSEYQPEIGVSPAIPKRPINDEQLQQLLKSILALYTLEGVGFKTICGAFDTDFLLDIWGEDEDFSNHPFIVKHKNQRLSEFAAHAKKHTQELCAEGLRFLDHSKITFTARGHSSYPEDFNKLSEPPRWLFAQGDINVLHAKAVVAIVGTRSASDEGIALARRIAVSLAAHNIVVASGLAKGIDEAAHFGCVEYYGETLAVLGEGINFNRVSQAVSVLRDTILDRGGVVISEYLPNDPPSSRSFLRRNALIVALSNAVIPIEFPKRESGTGSTILHARKLNVPVVGIIPENTTNKSLIATRDNFELEKVPIHKISNNLTKRIAEILKDILPNHQWYPGPLDRHMRLFRVFTNRIMQVKDRLELTEDSIDILADMLKTEIRKREGEIDDTGANL